MFFLELFGIWLPILFHALYGFYIWYRGDGNTVAYPWTGNWMYTAQRWTGGIAFVYIVWHTYTMRFTGIDLHDYPMASFGKVQHEVMQPDCSSSMWWAWSLHRGISPTASGCSAPSGASSPAKSAEAIVAALAWRFSSYCAASGFASLYYVPDASSAAEPAERQHRARKSPRPTDSRKAGAIRWQLPELSS